MPTHQQIHAMVKGVADAVTSAVSSKLSIWDKIFGTQDKMAGYTTVVLAGQTQLQVGEGTGIPNITPDPPSAYGQCSFPGGSLFVVQPPPDDPCAEQATAVQAALAALASLTDELHTLQLQLEGANHLERARLKLEIDDIQKRQLPLAQMALTNVQKQLQLCRAHREGQFGSGVRSFARRLK
jgi:hypothetical protein